MTIESAQLYLLQTQESFQMGGVVIAVGANEFVSNQTVPPGELWWVWRFFASTTLGAGAAANLAPSVKYSTLNTPVGRYVSGVATENIRAPADAGFWVQEGATFGCTVQSQTLAPTVQGNVVISRLRV